MLHQLLRDHPTLERTKEVQVIINNAFEPFNCLSYIQSFVIMNNYFLPLERGRVNIRDIRVVETVTIKDRNHGGSKHEDKKYANSFQIGYRTSSRQYSTKNNQHNNASNIPEFTLVVIAR